VEYHEEMDKMDPVFLPGLHFCTTDYSTDAENEINDICSTVLLLYIVVSVAL
jgi:hypothetical protein